MAPPDSALPPRADDDWYTALARRLVHALPVIVALQFVCIIVVAIFAVSTALQQSDIEDNQDTISEQNGKLARQNKILQEQAVTDVKVSLAARKAVRVGCTFDNEDRRVQRKRIMRASITLEQLHDSGGINDLLYKAARDANEQDLKDQQPRDCEKAAEVIPLPDPIGPLPGE